jgi:hypothetical protein
MITVDLPVANSSISNRVDLVYLLQQVKKGREFVSNNVTLWSLVGMLILDYRLSNETTFYITD